MLALVSVWIKSGIFPGGRENCGETMSENDPNAAASSSGWADPADPVLCTVADRRWWVHATVTL